MFIHCSLKKLSGRLISWQVTCAWARFLIRSVFKICAFGFFKVVLVHANLTLNYCHLPIKKMMWLSHFLSYTASILFVSGGRPIQKFRIWAGLLDTNDPSLLVLQNCAPFFSRKGHRNVSSGSSVLSITAIGGIVCDVKALLCALPALTLTFKEEDFSPNICDSVKASLTALIEWGVRPGTERFPEF